MVVFLVVALRLTPRCDPTFQDTWQTQAGEPLVSRHQTSSQQVATPHTNILTGDHRHHRMRRHGGG